MSRLNSYYDEPSITVTAKPALGLGTIGIITGIVLCILKAVGTLNISWFWATFPFWIVAAVELALIIIFIVIAFIVIGIEDIKDKRRNKRKGE